MPLNLDSYLLEQSPEFNLATGAENRTDLTLTPNPDLRKGGIAVYVFHDSTPIADAMVKILTPTGDPVDHQFSNAQGAAVTIPLFAGVYNIVAVAPGYVTSMPVTVNLSEVSSVLVNITMTPDPRTALNTLFGLVLDKVNGSRLGNATVILTDSQGQTINTTLTDSDGEYLIYLTPNGSYTISAQKAGYQLPTPISVNVTGGQLAQTNMSLTPEVATEGTVQGFIKDQAGNLLAGATVALYSVSGSTETLIQQTFTNSTGFYLFGGILTGNYLVKAKVDITL